MKKIVILGIFLIALWPWSGVGASSGFVIDDFKANLDIQPDGRLLVREIIKVSFLESLHGIYRDLPITYKKTDGSYYYTSIEVKSVSDGSTSLRYDLIKNNNNLRIKIGDPAILVSGEKKYIIDYLVSGVITPLADHDELYWNVTGNDWEALIKLSGAMVSVPNENILKVTCYEGSSGSNEECNWGINKNQAVFTAKRELNPTEGLTVVTSFPKGIVPILTVAEPENYFSHERIKYIFFSFIAVVFIAFIILLRLWWLKGRDEYYERKSLNDPLTKETILPLFGSYEAVVPEYDSPTKLRPGELGVLMDEKIDSVDISATIIDLAVRGYLIITEIKQDNLITKISNLGSGFNFGKTDYLLKKTNKDKAELLDYEKILLDKLFIDHEEVKISALKDNFTDALEKVRDSLYDLVKSKNLFVSNPEKVRKKYTVIGQTMFCLGLGCLFFYTNILDSLSPLKPIYINIFSIVCGLVAGLTLVGIILIFFSKLMPKRTAYGRDIYRQALGYKLFVSGTEKYRQPFFEKENIFMEVLPYAMVFGVTHKLAQAMKEMGLKQDPVSWYVGVGAFNANNFISNINDFSDYLSATASPVSSSSGFSGGSGGGFGGGGGGGW